ncbi:MAG: redoxin domain-containing protein [Desulfobacteraceae bacterium]|nr:redoxin domain-containing protein [Desulfobacteraceae bacterium]
MFCFKKMSLPLWVVCLVLSSVLFMINANSSALASEKEVAFSEIKVNKGASAPDFTLESLLGDNISIKDFRGHLVVVAFAFSKETAKNIENYRSRIFSDFKDKGVNCIKIVHINKPIFITKKFILKKMRREFKGEEPLKYLCIDWGGSLDLDEKYGVKTKDAPTLMIIGSEGRILYGLQGFFSEDSLKKVEDEISTILKVGENAYLGKSATASKKHINIGVTRIMYHPSFIWTDRGFKNALKEAGYIEGKNVTFTFQDAKADPDIISTIANKFINEKVDLIHTMSILTSQEIVKLIKDIPIVYSMVMNPIDEKVVATMGPTGTNVTGVATSLCALEDHWHIEAQLKMYIKFMPEAKRWGTIFNSGRVNSKFYMKELRKISIRMGIELVEVPVTKADEVKKAVESLMGKVDAVYGTPDDLMMSSFEDIATVCNKNKIPLFGGEIECVQRGAIAAYNLDYFLVGYKAGKKAIKILNGEKPGDIPSDLTKKYYLVISPKNAEKQGLSIPADIKKIADKIL